MPLGVLARRHLLQVLHSLDRHAMRVCVGSLGALVRHGTPFARNFSTVGQ
jgi:hypothetical protein